MAYKTTNLRVGEAARYLGVTPQSIRNWSNTGNLPCTYNGAGQRLYTVDDLDAYKNMRMGIPPKSMVPEKIFYVRTSNKYDVSLNNQVAKLTENFGESNIIFKDNASGLNDNRRGLNRLVEHIIEDDNPKTLYITNKDRLTRFGYHFLETFFTAHNTTINVLDSDDTKEPGEVLMQDFMSLLASFSGKFYRLRGWEQRKKFLQDVEKEVNSHVQTG